MKRVLLANLLFVIIATPQFDAMAQSDWKVWRGPNRNGIAAENQKPPLEWSIDRNILWKTKIPGRGHSSPIVVGDRVFLTTADNVAETQSVLCFDRNTGRQIWSQVANKGNFNPRIYSSNSHASPSVASDGKRVFAVFNNNDNIQITAFDLDGKQIWQKFAASFIQSYPFGYGASPFLYGSSVFVTSESQGESSIAGFDTATGKETLRIKRPRSTSYSTPVVANVAGREQMLISGLRAVTSYNPRDGSELWKVAAKWEVTCGTMVWHDDMVFASGGYPVPYTIAVRADGSGEKVWENRTKCYEQSMIVVDGYLYAHTDAGILYCWDARNGTEMWKGRLESPVSASPVLAGGHIYFTSERGNTFLVKPNPDKMELVATNKLGTSTYATPAIVDSQIFTRMAIMENGKRQEYVVCIGAR